MGHGCHDCGSPNSCECPPWEEMQRRKKEREARVISDMDNTAQYLLEKAQSWYEKISVLPRNEGVLRQTLRERALVIALLERLA